jgi:hypothetical protein
MRTLWHAQDAPDPAVPIARDARDVLNALEPLELEVRMRQAGAACG